MQRATHKLSLALLIFGLHSVVSGAMVGSCQHYPVTVPCETRGWHIVAEGLRLQPMNDDLEFLERSSSPRTRHAIKPSHKWGLRFEGGYNYSTGKDIILTWTHFNRSYKDHVLGTGDNQVHARAPFDLNIVNLELAQAYEVGVMGDLRLHFGAQWLRLNHDLLFETVSSQSGYKFQTDYQGLGLRAGVGWVYHLGYGFQVINNAAAAILVSNVKAQVMRKGQEQKWGPWIVRFQRRAVTPGLDGRSGVRWSTINAWGVFGIEAGWHAEGIFQSIRHLRVSGQNSRPQQNVSNFTYHGPYLNINYSA